MQFSPFAPKAMVHPTTAPKSAAHWGGISDDTSSLGFVTASVGSWDGGKVGERTGASVMATVGLEVGIGVGLWVGIRVGERTGASVRSVVGLKVGDNVGAIVGTDVVGLSLQSGSANPHDWAASTRQLVNICKGSLQVPQRLSQAAKARQNLFCPSSHPSGLLGSESVQQSRQDA